MSATSSEESAVPSVLSDVASEMESFINEHRGNGGGMFNEEEYDDTHDLGEFTVHGTGGTGSFEVRTVSHSPQNGKEIQVYPETPLFPVTESNFARVQSVQDAYGNLSSRLSDYTTSHEQELSHAVADSLGNDLPFPHVIRAFESLNTEVLGRVLGEEDRIVVTQTDSMFGDDGVEERDLGNPDDTFRNFEASDIDILYNEEPLAVVYGNSGGFHPREVGFVVGYDDTGEYFIHDVDHATLSPESDVTEQDIRRALRYDIDLDHDDVENPLPENKRTRVQGDLTIRKLTTFPSIEEVREYAAVAESVQNAIHDALGYATASELLKAAIVRPILSENENRLSVEITDTFVNNANDMLGTVFGTRMERDEPNAGRATRAEMNLTIAEQLAENPIVEDALNRDIGSTPELNTPLRTTVDNHLLSFGAASVDPLSNTETDPLVVIVPQDGTTLSITHHEHPEKRFALDAGLYDIRVLPHGIYPAEFTRPRW